MCHYNIPNFYLKKISKISKMLSREEKSMVEELQLFKVNVETSAPLLIRGIILMLTRRYAFC